MKNKDTNFENVAFYEKFFAVPRTRSEMRNLWGIKDSVLRDHIRKLQKAGLNIINLQDGKGYYIPEEIEKVARYAEQEIERGISCIAKGYMMIKRCGQENQIKIDDIVKEVEMEMLKSE